MTRGRILSLGSVNVDVQVRAPRWPAPGETVLVDRFLMTGGGKAANVAFLARRLGVDATLLACVGGDELAERALAPLRVAGVDLSRVVRSPRAPTGVAMIAVRERDAEKAILLASNANTAWPEGAAERIAAGIRDAPGGSVLVLDLELPVGLALAAARAAHGCGLSVVVDPSPADRVPDELLALATAVVPNPEEAAQLTDIDVEDDGEAAAAAGRALLERGARTAYIKLRHGGCVVVHGQRDDVVRAPDVDPIDKTGAGDAFAGALAVALLEGASPVDAARFAAAASALAVTRWGSQQAYPTRDEVTARTR